ncbi:MAG: hypothetical protein AABY22_04310 [Nanoarchaeota archaeon]
MDPITIEKLPEVKKEKKPRTEKQIAASKANLSKHNAKKILGLSNTLVTKESPEITQESPKELGFRKSKKNQGFQMESLILPTVLLGVFYLWFNKKSVTGASNNEIKVTQPLVTSKDPLANFFK